MYKHNKLLRNTLKKKKKTLRKFIIIERELILFLIFFKNINIEKKKKNSSNSLDLRKYFKVKLSLVIFSIVRLVDFLNLT